MLFLHVGCYFSITFALMKENLKKIFSKVKNFTAKNIMWIIGVLFGVWITFFDDFSLIDRFE